MKTSVKVISVFASIAIVIFLICQLFVMYYNSYETEYAYNYTAEDIIPASGIITRDETTLAKSAAGNINYNVSSGDRVVKDSLIANVYNKNIDLKTATQISETERHIALYSAALENKDNHIIDTAKINQRLESNIFTYIENISDKKYLSALNTADEFQKTLYQKQIVLGSAEDFNAKISEEQKKLSEYKKQNSNNSSDIYAPVSGIFVNQTDGYEDILKTENVKKMTPEEFEKVLDKIDINKQPQSVGKIFNDFEWFYTFIADEKDAKNFSVGNSCKIRLLACDEDEILTSVNNISSYDNGRVLITLRSNRQLSNANYSRKQSAEIILRTYSGLKIPKNAVRFIDGNMGVYVKVGPKVEFKKIESIYSKDNYIVSNIDDTNKELLSLYDEVIVKGKKLEDGKIIK